MAALKMAMSFLPMIILARHAQTESSPGAVQPTDSGTVATKGRYQALRAKATQSSDDIVHVKKVALASEQHTGSLHRTATEQRPGELSDVAAKSYVSIEAEAAALSVDVGNFQKSMRDSFDGIRDRCKLTLQKQRDANMEVVQKTAYAIELLRTMGREIGHLQRTAEKAWNDVGIKEGQLSELVANITMGSEFIKRALADSNDRMQNGQELKALAAFEKKSEATGALGHENSSRRLTSVPADDHHRANLLQFDREAVRTMDEDILSDMVKRLTVLNARGGDAKQKLVALCQAGMKQGRAQHEALAEEQASIEERLRSRSVLKRRLEAALQHITADRAQLKHRHRSLALFAKVAGDRAIKTEEEKHSQHVSLLQIAPGDSDALASVSSRVSQLQERLAAIEMENRRKQASHRAEYESRLRAKGQVNRALAQENMRMLQDVQQLHNSNAELRRRGDEGASGLEEWDNDWSTMTSNLSAALTVSQHALVSFRTLSNSPELSILHELDEHDKKSGALAAARHRFDDIVDDSRLQLLQLGRGTPKTLLRALDSGIADLEAQEAQVELQMKGDFDRAMKSEEGRTLGLQREQDQLRVLMRKEEALQARLQEAFDHYSSAEVDLASKGQSIRAYASRLGERVLPVALGVTPAVSLLAEGAGNPASLRQPPVAHTEPDRIATDAPQTDPTEDVFNTDIDFDSLPRKLEPTTSPDADKEELPTKSVALLQSTSSADSDGKQNWLSWFTR